MMIGIPKETFPFERRVAAVPEVVEKLIKLGFMTSVESGAGEGANFSDEDYKAAGATIVPKAADLWSDADIIFKVRAPSPNEVPLFKEGATLVSFCAKKCPSFVTSSPAAATWPSTCTKRVAFPKS